MEAIQESLLPDTERLGTLLSQPIQGQPPSPSHGRRRMSLTPPTAVFVTRPVPRPRPVGLKMPVWTDQGVNVGGRPSPPGQVEARVARDGGVAVRRVATTTIERSPAPVSRSARPSRSRSPQRRRRSVGPGESSTASKHVASSRRLRPCSTGSCTSRVTVGRLGRGLAGHEFIALRVAHVRTIVRGHPMASLVTIPPWMAKRGRRAGIAGRSWDCSCVWSGPMTRPPWWAPQAAPPWRGD